MDNFEFGVQDSYWKQNLKWNKIEFQKSFENRIPPNKGGGAPHKDCYLRFTTASNWPICDSNAPEQWSNKFCQPKNSGATDSPLDCAVWSIVALLAPQWEWHLKQWQQHCDEEKSIGSSHKICGVKWCRRCVDSGHWYFWINRRVHLLHCSLLLHWGPERLCSPMQESLHGWVKAILWPLCRTSKRSSKIYSSAQLQLKVGLMHNCAAQ